MDFNEIAQNNSVLADYFAEVDTQLGCTSDVRKRIKEMLVEVWDGAWWAGACES